MVEENKIFICLYNIAYFKIGLGTRQASVYRGSSYDCAMIL